MFSFVVIRALYPATISFTMFIEPVAMARWVLQYKVCPFLPLFRLLFELDHYFSKDFGMVLETQIKLRVTEPIFLEKLLLPQTPRKCVKIGSKVGFFEFIKKN